MTGLLANLVLEVSVVGAVCFIFLVLFVVAGIRQAIKRQNDNE